MSFGVRPRRLLRVAAFGVGERVVSLSRSHANKRGVVVKGHLDLPTWAWVKWDGTEGSGEIAPVLMLRRLDLIEQLGELA